MNIQAIIGIGNHGNKFNYNIQNIYVGTSANYKEIENNQYTGNESQAGDNIYTNLVLLINMI